MMNSKMFFCFVVVGWSTSAFAALPPLEDRPDEIQDECEGDSCVPDYEAPCELAADCGAGFTCEALEQCSCSSGAGGTNNESAEPVCLCKPGVEKSCRLIPVTCTTDNDCIPEMNCISGRDESTEPAGQADGDDTSADPEALSYCEPPDFRESNGASPGDLVSEESGTRDDLENSEFPDWECNLIPPESDGGCSTIEGDASLTLFGLLGLVGWFRRRR